MLAFLDGDKVTKREVVSRLGVPSETFEHDRVLTYRLGLMSDGSYFVSPKSAKGWEGVKFDLVLVFDSEGLLQRHNVVTIQKP